MAEAGGGRIRAVAPGPGGLHPCAGRVGDRGLELVRSPRGARGGPERHRPRELRRHRPGPRLQQRPAAAAQERTFLFLGRLDPGQKGLDLLLEGFALSGLSHARLVLVGPDWRGSERALQTLASQLAIAPSVQFTGAAFGQRKIDLLAGADVFVHPSRWEGLSFSVLEAAGLGKPCLLTAAADPGGKLGSAGAAVIVPPTADGIAAGLRTFAGMDPTALNEMGRRGRRVAEEEFAWPPVARRIVDAYLTHAVREAAS
jgi:Glycosyltransferase